MTLTALVTQTTPDMSLPSGTFNNASSGALQIFFSGEMTWSGSGWPLSNTMPDIVISCSVTDGTTTRTVFISRASTSNSVDWDYTGGTTLTCSTAVVHWLYNSPGHVVFSKLRIRAILIKR